MNVIKSTTTESVSTGTARIYAVILVGGTANSSVTLNDSLTGSGSDKISLKALANDSKTVVFGKNEVTFDSGVYSTISGSGAVVYIYYR
jgi:hypothetical protein